MSRVVAENYSPSRNSFTVPFYTTDFPNNHLQPPLSASSASGASPTLGQMLKRVGDVSREATGDGSETPVHQVLELGSTNLEVPRSIPFVLSFNKLTYSVKVRRKFKFPAILPSRNIHRLGPATDTDPVGGESLFTTTKTLLNDISGEARDGEILAVLGASGSGKSTLIDALANRIAKGSLKGTKTLNGEVLESRMLKVISAYVMQDDLLFPMLTVEETLMFAAEFRLPRSLSKSKKRLRVQALIEQLGLKNAAKTVIGDEGHRGVSGGERRRVSIGIDIIHDPIILFLDEPTSGLDSTSAFMVVKVLQRIAQSGSIVIMSVHQPSYRILGLLDRLIFLSRGQTVYSGSPMNLPVYFSDFGHPIPENENRTEFALDLIRELEGSPGGTRSLVEFNKSWQDLKHSRNGGSELDRGGLSLKEAISASISKGKLVSGATNNDAISPQNPVDGERTNGVDTNIRDGGDDGNKAPRLPRWTRQEILVLIQGKRVAENRVRRGRASGMGIGSGQIEPKWASVSSYCKRHGVNRGPVQCRKRWSNLAGDFKKIKEWETSIREETESFWVMRNDLRRERKLPGFFDREVYDILDGGGGTVPGLALALAPSSTAAEAEAVAEEVVFDSGRSAAAEDGLFSDFEQEEGGGSPEAVVKEVQPIKMAVTAGVANPTPISEKQYQPAPRASQAQVPPNDKRPATNPEMGSASHEERKRKRFVIDGDEETISLQSHLIDVLERNGKMLTAQLEAQNTNFQLDREQRKDHADGLVAVLNKLANALGKIADKL